MSETLNMPLPVFELPGALGAQLFSQPPNTLSNYVLGGQLHTIHVWFIL